MILRRLPVLAASVIATVAFLEVARDTPAPEPAVFATIPAPWMPSVPSGSALTSTWFCPGVPADGAEGSDGAFVLANAGPAPMQARVTLLAGPGQAVELPMTVEPYSRATVDPSASVAAPFVGAMVEIDRGGGLVEQWATQTCRHVRRPVHDPTVVGVVPRRGLHGGELQRAAGPRQPLRPVGHRRHRLRHRRRIAPAVGESSRPGAVGRGHRHGRPRRARRA